MFIIGWHLAANTCQTNYKLQASKKALYILKWKCRCIERETFIQIYRLCDHLKRMNTVCLCSHCHYAITNHGSKSVCFSLSLSLQSAGIDCCIVNYYELFRQITLMSNLTCCLCVCATNTERAFRCDKA